MKLFLVRNAETVWNFERRLQGQQDSALTKAGKEQAKALSKLLQNETMDIAYASDLGRAIDTAREILRLHSKVSLLARRELRERSHGIVEGLTQEQIFKKFGKTQDQRIKNKFLFKNPKGESYAEAQDRLKPFVEELKQKHFSQNVLVVSHAGINRLLLGLFSNLSPTEVLSIDQPNDCVYIIDNADTNPTVLRLTPQGIQAGLFERDPSQKPELKEDELGFEDE